MIGRGAALALMGMLAFSEPASAQEMPGVAAQIDAAGMRFTRALNGGADAARVSQGEVTITSGPKTDFFRETDSKTAYGNAPVLLTAIDNTKPFTFTTRVTPVLHETYDAGALYLWVREDHWLKMAMERDERGLSRVVTVRTHGTSDDNNHDAISAKSAFMRVSSDTSSIGFYYSLDGKSWQLVRVFRNDYPPRLWLGLSAQSPMGDGNSARFETPTLSGKSIANFRMGE